MFVRSQACSPAVRALLALLLCAWMAGASAAETSRPRNVIFMLSDDHRYDFIGCHPQAPKFLETPHLDRLAREGSHCVNAFVSTSLCSPSRASILTGQYMHHHRVVDNQRPVPAGTVFFPQYLQDADFATAFVGKWHMGHDNDERRPGFDHWISFKGQGTYFDPVLNVNGQREQFTGYNADILTRLAIQWLDKERPRDKPFFLYLSFKAVHYPFQPAPRHQGRYRAAAIDYPATMARTERNYLTQPRWVRDRRYSIHGIDHMETGAFDKDPVPDFDELYHGYCEAVHSLDENIGRVLDFLDREDLASNTLVVYMGDNGFHLGEHGFYDKRDAFETSIRVPLLARAPGLIRPGTKVTQMVQNIDVAPTLLAATGTAAPRPRALTGSHSGPCCSAAQPSGAIIFCTSITGSGISPRRPRCSRFVPIGTSLSTIMVCGTVTASTICSPIPWNAIIWLTCRRIRSGSRNCAGSCSRN